MRVEKSDVFAAPGGRVPDRPLIAVGDVHGHTAPLDALLAHLREHVRDAYGAAPVDLVFLGDYVDRGPDPLGTMARIRRGLELDTVAQYNLLGNHDWLLREAAAIEGVELDGDGWMLWLRNGGVETLRGLGFSGELEFDPEAGVAADIRAALGEENAAFLAELDYSFRSGDILCVHAGVDPRRPLERQGLRDLIWIREPFLSWDRDPNEEWTLPVTVVHGHTPGADGVFAHRIGVDTGGFHTGVFSAVEIAPAAGDGAGGAVVFHRVLTGSEAGQRAYG